MRLATLALSLPLLAQFDYDKAAPLDARQEPLAERKTARMWGGSFLGPRSTRVNYVLVEPKTTGRHPGILFQHGGGQSMANYISEALILAERGVTSLLVDVPGAATRESTVELVVTERRALDLLLRQPAVDSRRIGYVGHSYGGFAGAVLSGVEPRIHAFVLIGAVPSLAGHLQAIRQLDGDQFLRRAQAPVFVQCARFDTPDNLRACPEVHRLAGGPKRLTWYEDDHNFTSFEAMRDRLFWLSKTFKIEGVPKVLTQWTKATD